jgi:hypothetical protein
VVQTTVLDASCCVGRVRGVDRHGKNSRGDEHTGRWTKGRGCRRLLLDRLTGSGRAGAGLGQVVRLALGEVVALDLLLLLRVQVAETFEALQRDLAHGLVALDVVPVDAHEAVAVLVDDAHAQAAGLDGGVARLAAGVRLARGLDDVRAVFGPGRRQRARARGAADGAHAADLHLGHWARWAVGSTGRLGGRTRNELLGPWRSTLDLTSVWHVFVWPPAGRGTEDEAARRRRRLERSEPKLGHQPPTTPGPLCVADLTPRPSCRPAGKTGNARMQHALWLSSETKAFPPLRSNILAPIPG